MRHCVEGSYLKLRSLKPVKANLCQNDAGIFRIIARIPLPATEFSSVTNRHTNCATIKHERTNEQTNKCDHKVQKRSTQHAQRTADSLYESCGL